VRRRQLLRADLRWSNWGANTASATGTGQFTDCTPNCAQGKIRRGAIRVIATGRASCPGGAPAYANVTFAWIGRALSRAPFVMKLPCTSR